MLPVLSCAGLRNNAACMLAKLQSCPTATLGVDAQSEAESACILHSLSFKLLSCWRACSPVSCPETEHKGALTCLHLAPRSVQGMSVRMAPVIGTGSLGPISPQRSHYHVIWSGGDCLHGESGVSPGRSRSHPSSMPGD